MDDVLIFETGEREKLHALADHLALKRDDCVVPGVTLIVHMGVMLAMAAAALIIGTRSGAAFLGTAIVSTSVAGLALLGVGAFITFKQRPQLFGFDLISAAMGLCLVPWGTWIVVWLHGSL